jgi:hypothetical protein
MEGAWACCGSSACREANEPASRPAPHERRHRREVPGRQIAVVVRPLDLHDDADLSLMTLPVPAGATSIPVPAAIDGGKIASIHFTIDGTTVVTWNFCVSSLTLSYQWFWVSDSTLPSGSLNQATPLPPGDVQTPAAS